LIGHASILPSTIYHSTMSRTDPSLTDSYRAFEEHLDDYEYNVSIREGSINLSNYSLRRYVLDDMYQDSLLCPFVYMELHRENEDKERERLSHDVIKHLLFCLILYMLYMLYMMYMMNMNSV